MVRNKLLTKDDLLDILAEFYHERLRPDFEKVNKGLDKMAGRLEKVKKGLTVVEVELRGIKDNLKGLTAEFLDMPSRREFKRLKQKVERFHHTI